VESALKWASSKSDDQSAGQFSLFADAAGKSETPRPPTQPALEVDERETLQWEKDLLGIYLSGHPLDKYQSKLERLSLIPIHALEEMQPKTKVLVAGVVSDFKELRIKRGRRAGEFMATFKIGDALSQVEVVSFPDHYKEYATLFKGSLPLLMRAELDFEEDKPRLICGEIAMQGEAAVQSLEDLREEWPKKIEIELALDRAANIVGHDVLFTEIANVLSKHHGPIPVELVMMRGGRFQTRLHVGQDYHVQPSTQLMTELQNLVAIPELLKVKKSF